MDIPTNPSIIDRAKFWKKLPVPASADYTNDN